MRLLFGAYSVLPSRSEAVLMTNLTPHLLWITSRAAGFAALILASLAVSLGLLMSTKLLRAPAEITAGSDGVWTRLDGRRRTRRTTSTTWFAAPRQPRPATRRIPALIPAGALRRRRSDLISFHEILSLSTIVAIVVHAVTLLGDAYLHPSVADISIPFVSSYKTVWMSFGIVGGWSLALLGLSYYFRARIGAARWRKLHRFTALAWLAGLVHALGMGTDAGQLWFLVMVAIVAIPALGLLAVRLLGTRAADPATPRRGVRRLPSRVGETVQSPSAIRGDVRGISAGVVPTRGVPGRS
jgi:sulfoxide reductase heme-binding subunit YedZ